MSPNIGCLAGFPSWKCVQCVIGAGAAGLVAARELLREGHAPTVYEQGGRPGGVWVYTDEAEEGHAPDAGTSIRKVRIADADYSLYLPRISVLVVTLSVYVV